MTFKYIQRVGLVTAVLVGIAVDLPDASAGTGAGPTARRPAAASGGRRSLRRRLSGPSADVGGGSCDAPQGWECVRRGCRRRYSWAGSSSRISTAWVARRWSSCIRARGEGHVGRRPRLGAEGGLCRLVSVAQEKR